MKKANTLILVILVVLILAVALLFLSMKSGTDRAVAAQVNTDIDMSQVQDGVYFGEGDGSIIQAEVKVTVKDHRIVDIELLRHDNGRGSSAEAILEDMIAQNTDNVDAVTGATLSSLTIRNAVNKALQNGLQP